MASDAQFAKMNGLGNKILVVDMRGRPDKVTPSAAIALAANAETQFDQTMVDLLDYWRERVHILGRQAVGSR